MRWDHIPDSTPLDPQDLKGLIPSHIATQAELNEWEQANIAQALVWASANPFAFEWRYLLQLHLKMFDQTWKWAGEIRVTDKNLGVHWTLITSQALELLDEVKYQQEHQTFVPDEIAVRFHHRLVSIHPFPNGNGRHSRLAADLLVQFLHRPVFTWGSANLGAAGDVRKRYIGALQSADKGAYQPLLDFARSIR